MIQKEIIILAKSSKHSEYCIAGIDTTTGEWIRPVSDNTSSEGAVPLEQITYEDGTELQILDKVFIQFIGPAPTKSQPENYLYDPDYYWVKRGQATIEEVIQKRGCDNVNEFFYNTGRDVTEEEINHGPSLLLLNVEYPIISVKTFDNETSNKQRIDLIFRYRNTWYRYFRISDPVIKGQYADKKDGDYRFGSSRIVVLSLTGKYEGSGKYYKMVAQIF